MPPPESSPAAPAPTRWLIALAAAIPLVLVWDFSWESSIGIDLPWSAPHSAIFVVMLLAGLAALPLLRREPLAARVIIWGAAAFLTAWLFDRWWQTAYGLAAGLWGPPQLLKATAFFAVVLGVWRHAASAPSKLAFPIAGGALLALISMVTLPQLYANRQHSAAFYEIAAGTYPIVLAAQAVAGSGRFPATAAALCYGLMWGALVWLLPLFPAEPMVAPIINPIDHLLPPPFPLLLCGPALAFDLLWRVFPARRLARGAAVEGGLAFLLSFLALQWPFAAFLLSPRAEGWFLAGGGRHWPFFLQVAPAARTTFWQTPMDAFDWRSGLLATALAVAATFIGLTIGQWQKSDTP